MEEVDEDFSFFTLPVPQETAKQEEVPQSKDIHPVNKERARDGKSSNDVPRPDDEKSEVSSSGSGKFSTRQPGIEGYRQLIRETMMTARYQVIVVSMVILDMILVIAQLMLDLQRIHHEASQYLHYFSLALLTLFMFEIVAKVVGFGLEFFTHKLEVFDALVVIVAFILDIVYLDSSDAHSGLGLIIVLRLWRLVRIQNAMMLQVRRVEQKKVYREHQRRLAVEDELQRCRAYIATLQQKLAANNIPFEEEDGVNSSIDLV